MGSGACNSILAQGYPPKGTGMAKTRRWPNDVTPDENGICGFARKLRKVSIEERIDTAKRTMRESESTTRAIRERVSRGTTDHAGEH